MTEQDLLQKYNKERQEVECWTRVMGYFSPYSQYNKGKKQEFKDRKWFVEKPDQEQSEDSKDTTKCQKQE